MEQESPFFTNCVFLLDPYLAVEYEGTASPAAALHVIRRHGKSKLPLKAGRTRDMVGKGARKRPGYGSSWKPLPEISSTRGDRINIPKRIFHSQVSAGPRQEGAQRKRTGRGTPCGTSPNTRGKTCGTGPNYWRWIVRDVLNYWRSSLRDASNDWARPYKGRPAGNLSGNGRLLPGPPPQSPAGRPVPFLALPRPSFREMRSSLRSNIIIGRRGM